MTPAEVLVFFSGVVLNLSEKRGSWASNSAAYNLVNKPEELLT